MTHTKFYNLCKPIFTFFERFFMNTKKFDIILWIIIASALAACVCVCRPLAFIAVPVSGVFFAVRSFKENFGRLVPLMLAPLAVFAVFALLSGFNAESAFAIASNFFMMVLPGCAIGLSERSKKDFHFLISAGSLSYLAAFVTEFSKMRFYDKLDITEVLVNKPVKELFSVYGSVIANSGIENADKIADAMNQLQWYFQQAMAAIIPSLLIIMCAAMAFTVYLISRKWLCARSKADLSGFPRFCEISLPRSASFVLAALYAVSMFSGSSSLASALANILLVISAAYVVCGLSVIDFFLSKKRVGWVLRLVIYAAGIPFLGIFSALIPIVNVFTLLMLLGVIDGLLDFRHLRFGGERK